MRGWCGGGGGECVGFVPALPHWQPSLVCFGLRFSQVVCPQTEPGGNCRPGHVCTVPRARVITSVHTALGDGVQAPTHTQLKRDKQA